MADLLLELFSEEIPARMQADASRHLAQALLDGLRKDGSASAQTTVQSFVTPRRLGIIIDHLATEQAASEREEKGPKTTAPDAAVMGFCKKFGIGRTQLTERDGTYFALIRTEGKNTTDTLKPLIESILAHFPWPKSMRWGAREERWVRPLKSILCLFNGQIIPIQFAGITAGNTTYGHRFLSPAPILIRAAAEYEPALEKAFVIADAEKRKQKIRHDAEALAAKQHLKLRDDAGLLDEVTGLVEWPVPLIGSIDNDCMSLPQEVLISEMREHQRYFALYRDSSDLTIRDPRSANHDSLAPHFLTLSNMETPDHGRAIIAGNERVLRARLADGRFFWEQDRKKPLEQWAEGLKTVTFHARLGTTHEKVERITALAKTLAKQIPGADSAAVERAARLCKADLVTGMVGEFPELQGVMGRYYALHQNEDARVADAIRDHYKPLGPADAVPSEPTAVCVALADKLDTLIGMFAIGEKPTGSKDPFALRRAALGIIRIILENRLRLSLRSVILSAVKDLKACTGGEKILRSAQDDIIAFFADRLKVQLKDQGIRHDIIDAVFALGDDDLLRVVTKAKALQEFLKTANGTNLLAAYKRAANILAIEEKKDGHRYVANELQSGILREEAEKELSVALSLCSQTLTKILEEERFVSAMESLSTLRQPLDTFFDAILVNDPNPELRANRLRLLASIRATLDNIADFSVIEG